MSDKLPSFQFYPGDWRKDMGVQSLDYFARGIWWEMICLMHESEERGVLILNGKPMAEDRLAVLLGLDKQILTTHLTTLLTTGVAGRREGDGAIYCRRMVKDEHLRSVRKKAGSLGGNPILVKQNPTTGVKQNPTPSSSSSSSSSSSDKEQDSAALESVRRNGKSTVSQCEAIYQHYPRKVGREAAIKAIGQAVKRLAESRDDPHAYLLDRTVAYARSPAGRSPPAGANDYRPHPSTWFNQGRYDDDEQTWQRSNGVNGTDRTDSPGRIDAPVGKYAHLSRPATVAHSTSAAAPPGEPQPGERF